MDKYDAECIIGTTKQFLMAAGGMLDIYRFEKDRESVLYAIFESYGFYFASARYFNACVDFIMSVDGGKDIYLPDMREIDKLCNSIEFNSEDWKYKIQDRLHSIIVSIASGARRFIEFANKLPGATSSVEDAGTPAVEGDASSVEDAGTPAVEGDASSVEGTSRKKTQSDNPLLADKKFKRVLRKLIEKKICDENYDWKRSKRLFAYFAHEIGRNLGLSVREVGDIECACWKPFLELFTIGGKEIKNIAQAWKRCEEYVPRDSYEIDSILHKIFGR